MPGTYTGVVWPFAPHPCRILDTEQEKDYITRSSVASGHVAPESLSTVYGLSHPFASLRLLVMEVLLQSEHIMFKDWRDMRRRESEWKLDICDPKLAHE
jgi:hypothetical protein